MWIDESFAAPSFVNSLAHADRWFEDPSCQIIKDQEKTKVGRLIIRIGECDHLVFLKQFNAASRRHWIGSWFVSSRAFKTLEGASILRSAQVPIAVPFAAVEQKRWGGLTNSLFLTREVIGGKTTDAFWRESLRPIPGREGFIRRRTFLRGLAGIFRSLHARRIYHNDLKEANILVVQHQPERTFDFFLLDLEGVRRCVWLSERRRVKNLVQLYRTFGRHISRAENLCFLKGYLGPAFLNRKRKRELIARIVGRSRRLEASKARRTLRIVKSN